MYISFIHSSVYICILFWLFSFLRIVSYLLIMFIIHVIFLYIFMYLDVGEPLYEEFARLGGIIHVVGFRV